MSCFFLTDLFLNVSFFLSLKKYSSNSYSQPWPVPAVNIFFLFFNQNCNLKSAPAFITVFFLSFYLLLIFFLFFNVFMFYVLSSFYFDFYLLIFFFLSFYVLIFYLLCILFLFIIIDSQICTSIHHCLLFDTFSQGETV